MSTGYDEEGTRRLRCLAPPDDAAAVFVPTAFAGMYPVVETYAPTVPIGVGNFSFECWFKWALGNSNITSDVWSIIGAMVPVGGGFYDPVALVRIANTTYQINTVEYRPPGGPTISMGPFNVPPSWCHIAVNFNRAANMECFIDTVSVGAVAINNANCGSPRFYPLCGQFGTDLTFDPSIGNWDTIFAYDFGNFTQGRARMGPLAFHNRLLTAAEIRLAWERKRVNDFGTATTLLRWDWRETTGQTGWDHDWTHLVGAIRATMSLPSAAPTGPSTTVTVPDQSLNGRVLTLASVASYGTTPGPLRGGVPEADIPGRRAWTALVADPFWS